MTDSAHREHDDAGSDDDAETGRPPHSAVEQAPPRRPIDWARISDFITAVRSAIVNVAMLLSALALIGLTVMELRHRPVVIDPIRLPGALSDVGYSEDVAAQRLADAVQQIKNTAPTAKQGISLLTAAQLPDIEPADAGFSLQNVVQFLRQILKLPETRIGGEFICTTPDCAQEGLMLRLRVLTKDGMKIIALPPVGGEGSAPEMDRYFTTAALELLRALDPYVAALYVYDTDKDAAEREALRILGPDNPHRKWAMNLLGYLAAERKDHDAAVDWYQRAAAADEKDAFAIAYTNWGNALLAKGDVDGAIEKQQRAIQIDPEYAFAYLSLADALEAKHDPDGALAKIAQAAGIKPESAFAYNIWGNALYTRGKLDGAIEKYRHATEIDPSDALAYFNWGRALADKHDDSGAIARYIRAVELEPGLVRAHVNLGIALRKRGDLEGAIEQYRLVTEIDPSDALAYFNWGLALADKNEPSGAIGKFSRAAELNPTDSDIYLHWGMALKKTGDILGAAEKVTHATELDPRNGKAQLSLGVILRTLNRTGEAAAALQLYLDHHPDAGNADQVRALVARYRAEASGG